jgi:predicted nucleic acid-binding protein
VALADGDDDAHLAVLDFISGFREPLIVPITVIVESDYIVANRLGTRVEVALLKSIASGDFAVESCTRADLDRSIQIVEQYADSNVGVVDASIVAIAERLKITRILTLDARHFRMFRPRHCEAFELIP